MADYKITGEASLDTSKAEASMETLGRTAKSVSDNIVKETAKASGASKGIGDSFDQTTAKISRAEQSIINSIKRTTTQMELLGKTASEKLEFRINAQGLDPSKFDPLLRKLKEVEAAQQKADSSLGGLSGTAAKVSGALASIGVGLSLAGVVSFVKSTVDAVDALNDLKDSTGASIENLSALEDVAKRTGASMQVVEAAMLKFNKIVFEGAGDKDSNAAKALDAIGLSAKELSKIDPAEALRQTAVALTNFADDANKARLVQELFGKSVKEVAPFLKDLAEKGELIAKVTSQQAEEAEKFNKQLFNMKADIAEVGKSIAMSLVPGISELAAVMATATKRSSGFLDALRLIGLTRFGSNGLDLKTDIANVVEELNSLEAARVRYIRANADTTGIDQSIASFKNRLEYLRDLQRQTFVYSESDQSDAEARRLGIKRPASVDLSGLDKKPKAEKDNFVQGQEAAKEWAKYMEDLAKASNEADGAMLGLTKTQIKLTEYLGSSAYLNVPEPWRQLALQAMYARIEQEQLAESTKGLIKTQLDYAKVLQAQAKADMDEMNIAVLRAEAVDAQVKATEYELSLMGKSRVERDIALKQYKIEIESQKEIARIKKTIADPDIQRNSIEAEQRNAERLKANVKAEVINEEFQRVSLQIENSLTDALMRGFESGKDFAKNFRDTLVNMFKTLVLRPVISAVMNPIAGGIAGSLGLAGTANAATSGLSMLGSVGATGNLLGSLGASASYGTSLISQQGAMLAAQEAGMGTLAGSMSSIGSALPWIGGILAVASLIKSLDDSGTAHTGGSAMADMVDGIKEVESASIGFHLAAQDVSKSVVKSSKTLAGSALDILKGLDSLTGGMNKFSVATGFADDSSKDGSWGNLAITKNGQSLVDWRDTQTSRWAPKVFADGEAGAKEYGDAVAAGIKQAIDTLELPDWAGNIVKRLGESPSLEELSAAMQQIQAMPEQMLQAIGTSSQQLGDMIYEGMQSSDPVGAGKAVADQITYGIESSIYNGFGNQITSIISTQLITPVLSAMQTGVTLTEAMSKASIQTMTAQIAAAGKAFAAIVNDPGFKTALAEINTLIAETIGGSLGNYTAPVAPAVYQPIKDAEEAAKAAAKAAEDLSKASEDLAKSFASAQASILSTNAQLQADLLRAQGDNLGARAIERAQYLAQFEKLGQAEQDRLGSLYDQNNVIKDQIQAIEDQKKASEAAKEAAEKARDSFLALVDAAYSSADRMLEASEARMFKLEVLAQKLVQAGGGADAASYVEALGSMDAAQVKKFVQEFLFSGAPTEAKGVILDIGNSLLDMIDLSAEAAEKSAKAIEEAAKRLQDAGKGIAEYITKTRASMGGTRSEAETLNALRINYLTDLSKGRVNDLDALGRITSSADAYIQSVVEQSSSAFQAQAVVSQVLAELSSLPAVQSYEAQSLALLGKIDTSTATSATLTAESIAASLGATFDGFDVNVDGGITFAEMQTALNGKATDAEIKALFTLLDTDNDGIISRLEATKNNTALIKQNFWDTDQFGIAAALQWHVDMLSHTVQSTNYLSGILAKLNAGINVFGLTSSTAAVAAQTNTLTQQQLQQAVTAVAESAPTVSSGGPTLPQASTSVVSAAASTSTAPAANASFPGNFADYLSQGKDFNDYAADYSKWLTGQPFALGGMFTNGIVQRPTAFDMGLMGEAGPEAIMPLSRNADGSLGITARMPDFSGTDNTELVDEIRNLRQDNRAQASALAALQQRIVKLHERWDRDGIPETRVTA